MASSSRLLSLVEKIFFCKVCKDVSLHFTQEAGCVNLLALLPTQSLFFASVDSHSKAHLRCSTAAVNRVRTNSWVDPQINVITVLPARTSPNQLGV